MTFLGLEKPVEYGSRQIFDPTMANMVLQAQRNYVNAVKDDYLRGLAELQDFNKEYADLDSPILADNTSYYNLTKGGIKNMFDEAAKQGVDLLRTPEGRMMVANYIATRPYDKLANLRKSRDAANEFLKARKQLEAQGLYNPLLAKYDAPDMSTYDTLQQGIWDKMSPTPYQNMADFSKAYFDNISPIQRSATKNGISYTISEITEPMLQDIADRHFNDLVNTPQGRLMYKMYLDQTGGDANAARQAFDAAVVSGNLDRKKYADDYVVQQDKAQDRALKRQALSLQQQNFNLKKRIAEAKLNPNNNVAKSWTERQRTGVMMNHDFKSNLRLDLAKVKMGTTPYGAKLQLISDGILHPTQAQINAKIKENKAKLHDPELRAKYYASYTTNVEGGDLLTARALFAGLNKEEAVADIAGIKRKPIQFSPKSNLSLTTIRQQEYGGLILGENALQKYLDKNHISGYATSDLATVSYKDYANGRGVFDINSTVSIKASDLERFKEGDVDARVKALKNAGAVIVNKQGKVVTGDGKIGWDNIDRVELPVSRTIDSHSYVDSEIDTYHEALNFTKKVAKDSQSGYENDDLIDMIYE